LGEYPVSGDFSTSLAWHLFPFSSHNCETPHTVLNGDLNKLFFRRCVLQLRGPIRCCRCRLIPIGQKNRPILTGSWARGCHASVRFRPATRRKCLPWSIFGLILNTHKML